MKKNVYRNLYGRDILQPHARKAHPSGQRIVGVVLVKEKVLFLKHQKIRQVCQEARFPKLFGKIGDQKGVDDGLLQDVLHLNALLIELAKAK